MKSSGPIPFPASVVTEANAGKPSHISDPLGEFGFEAINEHERPATARQPTRVVVRVPAFVRRQWLVITLAILAIGQIPFVVLWALQPGNGFGTASTGNLVVDTEPAGIEVRVDGNVVGTAPLKVSLSPGKRTIELRHGGVVRSFPVIVAGGETLRHRFEFIPSAPQGSGGAGSGTLQVTTEPSRVTVLVDGAVKGTSPVSIGDLSSGEHNLSVRFPTGTVERRVQVNPGSTASVQIAMPSPRGSLSGWVDVDVPVSLRISEQGRLLGTTDIDRLMLPVGEHVLDIGSDELGFRTQKTVTVTPGATTTVQLDLPRASLSINARPWAEAWVDGERVGETPIGNLSRPIGRHEVVLRHPELGERRESVLITLNQPARVTVDFRQRP